MTWPKKRQLQRQIQRQIQKQRQWQRQIIDLWHLRHWLQLWQLRTWFHDNLCYLTIKSYTGQHSQFLRCFPHSFLYQRNQRKLVTKIDKNYQKPLTIVEDGTTPTPHPGGGTPASWPPKAPPTLNCNHLLTLLPRCCFPLTWDFELWIENHAYPSPGKKLPLRHTPTLIAGNSWKFTQNFWQKIQTRNLVLKLVFVIKCSMYSKEIFCKEFLKLKDWKKVP